MSFSASREPGENEYQYRCDKCRKIIAAKLAYPHEHQGGLAKPETAQAPSNQADTLSSLLDSLVEKRYQLRLEHNHGDMKWYAYYAGKELRNLFDKDIDWETMSDTPSEAVTKLNDLVSKHPEWRYERF